MQGTRMVWWRLLSPRTKLAFILCYTLGVAGVGLGLPSTASVMMRIGPPMLMVGFYLALFIVLLPCIRIMRAAREWRLPFVMASTHRSVLWLIACMMLPPVLLAWWLASWMGAVVIALVYLCAVTAAVIGLTSSMYKHPFSFGMSMLSMLIIVPQNWIFELANSRHFAWLVLLAGTVAVLTALAAWRWHGLRHDEHWEGSAMVYAAAPLSARDAEPWNGWNRTVDLLTGALHATWLPPLRAQPDMRRLGPRYRQRSLRMALGGFLLPQISSAQTTQRAPFALAILAVGSVIGSSMYLAGIEGFRAIGTVVVIMATLLCSMLTLTTSARLRRLWSRPNAEMPLLALLPGLRPTGRSRLWILCAINKPLFVFLAMELVCCLLEVSGAHGGRPMLALVAGLFLGNMTGAITLPLLAWIRIPAWPHLFERFSWLFALLTVFTVIEVPAALLAKVLTVDLLWLTGLMWLLFSLMTVWFGFRHYRRWRRLPHPFLAPGSAA